MSNELRISKKFEPLFKLFDNNYHPEIDTVIITGGRYSLKSYTVSIFSLLGLYNLGWNTLYTRFTNMSITDSVKPEVSDKVDLLGLGGLINDTNTHLEYESNRISFKGIKTGSKGQTANLKSLSGFNLFVNDEAEELPDFETFKKIFYSIRSTDKRNLSILILNPTTKDHWIFKEFFEKKDLNGGENCIIDNVMYIHSSYLDCDFNLMPKNILADYLKMKVEDKKRYETIVLGGWIEEPEGILLPKSTLKFVNMTDVSENDVVFSFGVNDPADTGGDKYAIPFIYVVQTGDSIGCFVKDFIYNTNGIEANTERTRDKMCDLGIEQMFVESNGVGLASVLGLKKILNEHQKLTAFPSTVNKDVRILSHYEFVQKYFIFDSNYEQNQEYKSAIHDLTTFSKEGDNKHKKDSIDSLCLAASIIKIKYKKLLYG